jgi:hypothetical protein
LIDIGCQWVGLSLAEVLSKIQPRFGTALLCSGLAWSMVQAVSWIFDVRESFW